MKKKPDIVFMGTPEFATATLEALLNNNYNISAVVTAPDKPAGRGKKIRMPDVKKFALKHNLNILQPTNLKDESFISQLKSLNASIFVVVAFRMLPNKVWEIPSLGCFNIHASLLPDYRGAAPINHAIINGEKITGVTSFFINENIDTGDIILQKKVEIKDDYTAGNLHDILMKFGADVALKTVSKICKNNVSTIRQNELVGCDIKYAPKLSRNFCKINWEKNPRTIYNFIRGLSPYPGAFTILEDNNKKSKTLKIFKSRFIEDKHNYSPSKIISDNKKYIKIVCNNGFIFSEEVQLEGKKRMNVEEFLRGNDISDYKIKD